MEIIIFLFGVVFGAVLCGVTMWIWPPRREKQDESVSSTASNAVLDEQWENLLRYDGTNQFTKGEEPDDESGENGL